MKPKPTSKDESEAKEADDQILDSRADMSNGVDKQTVQDAALKLQKKLIEELEAKTGVATAPADDVLDSATGMSKGTDHDAVRSAAVELQKKLVAELESQSKKREDGGEILHSATDMTTGVDSEAVKAAAVSLQEKLLAELDGVKKDSASFHKLLKNAGLAVRHHAKSKKPSLAQQIRAKLSAQDTARTQMLSDTMLLPINSDPDLHDKFNAKHDDKEEKEIMRKRLGTLDRTDEDLEAEARMREREDTEAKAGLYAPTSFEGGVGSQSHMHPTGAQAATWYASWWDHPNFEDVAEAVAKTLGDGQQGRQKLVQEGVNVAGWEPGRTTEEVREDHLTGKQMPAGFWDDDGKAAYVPDEDIHHPCGSPKRVRPCEDDDKSQAPEGSVPTAATEGNGSIWQDPMPYETLKHDRNVAEGKEDEDEDEDEEEQEE